MEDKPFTPNPYDILGVPQTVSKGEIIKAVNEAIKRKQYPVKMIAEAQKSLQDPKKRLLADYLRSIPLTIHPFERGDFSSLSQPEPQFTFIPKFDGLTVLSPEQPSPDISHSHSQTEPEPTPKPTLQDGINACREGHYQEAIQLLDLFCQTCSDHYSKDYFKAKTWLLKAYKSSGSLYQARALCKELINSENPQIQTWAEEQLKDLSP